VISLCGNHDDWMLRTRRDFRKHTWLLATDPFVTMHPLIWGGTGFPERYRGQDTIVYGHHNNAVLTRDGWPQPAISGPTIGIDTISHGVLTAVRMPGGDISRARATATFPSQSRSRNLNGTSRSMFASLSQEFVAGHVEADKAHLVNTVIKRALTPQRATCVHKQNGQW
jgi:hypothetical protein